MGLTIALSQVPVEDKPWIPASQRRDLREALIKEEAEEVADAIGRANPCRYRRWTSGPDIYVCLGAALEFGIPLDLVFDEVHRTNMLKVGGAIRSDGKILKPEGWKPPDIAAILAEAKESGHDA